MEEGHYISPKTPENCNSLCVSFFLKPKLVHIFHNHDPHQLKSWKLSCSLIFNEDFWVKA